MRLFCYVYVQTHIYTYIYIQYNLLMATTYLLEPINHLSKGIADYYRSTIDLFAIGRSIDLAFGRPGGRSVGSSVGRSGGRAAGRPSSRAVGRSVRAVIRSGEQEGLIQST